VIAGEIPTLSPGYFYRLTNPIKPKETFIMSLFQPFTQKFQTLRAALKERSLRLRLRVSAWWQAHRRTLWRAMVIVLIGLAAGIALALLWRRSPTLRAAVIGAAAAAVAFIRPGPRLPVEPLLVPVLEPVDNHREPFTTF
jgi:ABC-type nitrate/sulfonate/bicarbonate transport system permease component